MVADLDKRHDAVVDQLAEHQDAEIKQVIELEHALLDPAVRKDARRLSALIDPDFVEITSSGTVLTADEAISTLVSSAAEPTAIEVRDETAQRIGDDVVAVRWTSVRDGRSALRSSVWRRTPDGWQIVLHQGTPLGD